MFSTNSPISSNVIFKKLTGGPLEPPPYPHPKQKLKLKLKQNLLEL